MSNKTSYVPPHLFYIGDNVSDDVRNSYQDYLIFDRERNSIYAKNHEFGYICDYEKSIDLRNADNTNKTTITLSVVNGQINFYEYRSVKIISYTPICSVEPANATYSGLTYVLGSTVTLNKINNFAISGTETTRELTVTNTYNSMNYDNTSIYEVSNSNFNESGIYTLEDFENNKFYTYQAGSKNVASIQVTDTQGQFDIKNVYINWQNNVMLYKWSYTSKDYYGLQDIINSKSTLSDITNELGSTTLYNKLTSNYKIGGSTVTCNNGPDEYLALCCPTRLQNANSFTGILGGSSVQEFKKIKTVSYTNSASYTENYNIYLATGHNWNGSILEFK